MKSEICDAERSEATVDAFTAEVIRSTVVAITDEMKTNLMRTAYNMIIYEAEDFTVGLFDRRRQHDFYRPGVADVYPRAVGRDQSQARALGQGKYFSRRHTSHQRSAGDGQPSKSHDFYFAGFSRWRAGGVFVVDGPLAGRGRRARRGDAGYFFRRAADAVREDIQSAASRTPS